MAEADSPEVIAIEKIDLNPGLSEIINKLNEIKAQGSMMNTKMLNFLTSKNISVTEEEKTVSSLISKMKDYANNANSELTTLINEIATLETNKTNLSNQLTTLSNQITSLNSQKTTLSNEITSYNNTNTSNKSTLITELNQWGATGLSTSSSMSSIATMIYTLYSKALTAQDYFTYTVYNASGSGNYGFAYNSSDGFFESQNKGVSSSYAMCYVTTSGSTSYVKYIDYISYAENNYDYALVSTRGKTLTANSSADTSNVLFNTKGKSSSAIRTYQLGSTNGTYYIKFIKDSSGNSYNDSFKFRLRGA